MTGRGSRKFLVWLALATALASTSTALSAGDTRGPQLKSFRFSPDTIQTGSGPSEVTINFTATDDSAGIIYLEAVFVDQSGTAHQSASASFAPTQSAISSIKVNFPRFSNSGTWTLDHVLLADMVGNTCTLDAEDLVRKRLPTRLEVVSTRDTVSPKLTVLEFSPAEVDTSEEPAEVKVTFTATDDLSGVSYLELGFVSPSGTTRRSSTMKFNPAQVISNGLTLVFPAHSEPGQWMLSSVFLMDAANNTLVLDAKSARELGFRTLLNVRSSVDTTRPALRSIEFAPDLIDTKRSEGCVTFQLTATDDLSGVQSFEIVFTSPSGAVSRSSVATFSPAKEVTHSLSVTFPRLSEPGSWTLTTVVVTDAAGNTLIVDADMLPHGTPNTLRVR